MGILNNSTHAKILSSKSSKFLNFYNAIYSITVNTERENIQKQNACIVTIGTIVTIFCVSFLVFTE